MPGYKRTGPLHLAAMQPNMSSFSTIALIICKSEPNIFLDKQNNEFRGVICFTLRDSKHHITNCKCWGSRTMIEEYNSQLHIGDVVDVVGAKVMQSNGNVTLRYQPKPTLPCVLVVNEGQGFVAQHNLEDMAKYQELLQLRHLPHKPMQAALKLADVCTGVQEQRSAAAAVQYVDLLVVVGSLRPVRELKRKNARDGNDLVHCLELVVFDQSWPDGLVLTLWHTEWIQHAKRCWQPRKTVLHLIDVRVSYSEYFRSPVLGLATCTIIYEDPQGVQCQALVEFAATMPARSFDVFAQVGFDTLPAAEEIRTQMTVKQIYARAEGDLCDAAIDKFTAVLYAMITKFDLDGYVANISKRCKVCQRHIPQDNIYCSNENCQLEFSMDQSGVHYEKFFNINIQLTDHTGTLIETRLTSGVAEQILGLSADAFEQLTQRQKAELKWRFLLKHFAVKLLVKKPTVMRQNPIIAVVDMQLIDIKKLIDNMTVF